MQKNQYFIFYSIKFCLNVDTCGSDNQINFSICHKRGYTIHELTIPVIIFLNKYL